MKRAHHPLEWLAPAPLWSATADARLRGPVVLGFEGDDFMKVLEAKLAREGASLDDLVVAGIGGAPAKLFQAVHGRHYLVAASLVCRLPGLPEHRPDRRRKERLAFVLRRQRANEELAWCRAPGATTGEWRVVTEKSALAGDEQLHPLFSMSFVDRTGRARTLHTGVVPTTSRELTTAAPVSNAPAPDGTDARHDELRARIIVPFESLKQPGSHTFGAPAPDAVAELQRGRAEASAFLLLDLSEFLHKYIPAVHGALLGGPTPANHAEHALYSALAATQASGAAAPSFLDALAAVHAGRGRLLGEEPGDPPTAPDLASSPMSPGLLERLIADALPPAEAAPSATTEVSLKQHAPGAVYVLRAVLTRTPCGPDEPRVVVSDASQPFAIAPVYDVDAPAREIRIELPTETSIAALRRAKKSVGFALSSQLRKQLCRVVDAKKVLDGNLATCTEPSFGEIWVLSMPIITIVAMIILLIVVHLLNIVFWWLPFFRIRIRIPGGVS